MTAELQRNADLGPLSTFRLPARAAELAVLDDVADLPRLLDTERELLLLGGGSNTLFVGDPAGRVVLNRLLGRRFHDLDADRVLVEAAAGEDWHKLVEDAVARGLWGLENLTLIPGSVGAAPMQNIGAYGVELADLLDAVEVFDRATGQTGWIGVADCALGYRTSRFKNEDRYVLLAVRLVLTRSAGPRLDYPALAEALTGRSPAELRPADVANAVMGIRRSKLPDPALRPNAGSFFKNPVVDAARADELLARNPELPCWEIDGRRKLSAAWMIDRLGWRGRSIGGARVYDRHALVLTNDGSATGADVLALARAIRDSVGERFGVTLEPEPRLVGGAL
ncbi:UDP-N-acetylmuramate dehydrogenase [Wenzhouxiangella sp. XN79A]|uniref:UDP-N-acetylmuramate dehydrogenase n=1 Tax=Wenzhouxiangella sp. XN79A TaxID=2724193 RepID=UPI00144A502D|nr:UDP-N-acetylmuramate dehydrogenase [Wenzhouxiangella sp. XN79A]NKI33693.1 UDP-N-acetylmuramate dehydrogenase [Wenzhouxiangella sp. XN79A]